MKKWIRVITVGALIVCLVVVFAACSKENKTVEENVTEDKSNTTLAMSEETQKELSIVVNPVGWEPVEGTVLPAQYMKGTASFMAKIEGFSGDTLDEVVEQSIAAFENSFDNVVVELKGEKITVDGREASKLIFSCTVSGMDMKYEYVYLFVGDSVWAITFADFSSSFDSLTEDYVNILNGITFK